MGGRFGRNRNPANDPFYNAAPPVAPLNPSGGLDVYDPYEEYAYEYQTTSSIGNLYGGQPVSRPTKYGGLYAQGFNQFPGICPWNYGNYYLGNTAMQMMPFMLNNVAQYGQMQAMASFGNAGLLGAAAMMPRMPCCMPPSFSMPMGAPMMAAATPLPIAFNPLVQGMYPMASMNPVNWMTPSSFMSALTSGPMPYRPPAFDFPSNVGMVMTIPYGTPNPLLSPSSYGGFGSSYGFGSPYGFSSPYGFGARSSSCCYNYCMPPPVVPALPNITYYPRPMCVPQPYPIPYPAPVAIPNIQQVPVPRPVSVVAPPILAGYNQQPPIPFTNPLAPSQGVFTNGAIGQSAVMASNYNSTNHTLLNSGSAVGSLPVYNPLDQSNSLIGQPVLSSLSNPALNNTERLGVTPSKAKYKSRLSRTRDDIYDHIRRYVPSIPRLSRSNYDLTTSQRRYDPILPPITHGELISDSGWLPKDSGLPPVSSMLSRKNKKRSQYTTKNGKSILHPDSTHISFLPHRRRHRHRSSTSTSEYDCAICQQQREKRRLRDYYNSSTVSSLLSGSKKKRYRLLSPHQSSLSPIQNTPKSGKKKGHKSHRRHPAKIKRKSKSPPIEKSNSPKLLRRSPLQEAPQNSTIHEVDEEDDEDPGKKLIYDSDSSNRQPNHHTSQISLGSIDE